MPTTDTTDEQRTRPGRSAVIGFTVLTAAAAAYFALGMPGMDHSGPDGTMAGMDHSAAGEPMPLSPRAFADRLADPGVFVVNVHVPAGPAIAGTDATVAYDRLLGDGRLPADKGTSILLYCQTGRMSADAGRGLMAAGYTDV
ncbi:MAG: rhodanese-like domain-containing protein, partial [Actinomycetes bacterium]